MSANDNSIKVVSYIDSYINEWDKFVANAKNGHFMFFRSYMDYHQDRFVDASLMIYSENKLLAVFPANSVGDVIHSHQGLTFGGLIMAYALKAGVVIEIFNSIVKFFQQSNIEKVIYKAIPHIYHQYAAEEDLYALYRLDAVLIRRDIGSAILMDNKISFIESRKSSLRKAVKNKLYIEESESFDQYWKMLSEELLSRHHCVPTHAVIEIKLLAKIFPENIKLFVVYSAENQLLAGVVIYLNKMVVHTQYMISSDEGKKNGALDFVLDYLINDKYVDKKWFDFGVSTEKNGLYLNEGLIFQKEGFGSRGVVHDFYAIPVKA